MTPAERKLLRAQDQLNRAMAVEAEARAHRDLLVREVIAGGRSVLETADVLGVTRLTIQRAREREVA